MGLTLRVGALARFRMPAAATLAALVTLAGGLALTAAPASAAIGFSAVRVTPPEGFGFSGPVGVAVDNSADGSGGSLYVADAGFDYLQKLSDGRWETGQEVPGASFGQIAVDNYANANEGDVYAASPGQQAVYVFDSALERVKEIRDLSQPTAVSIDERGDVLVADATGAVSEFGPAGEPVDAAGAPDSMNTVAEGLASPQGIAVSANGTDLYVATASGTIAYTLSGGVYKARSGSFDAEASNGVAVAASGDVFVNQGNDVVAKYEPSGGAPVATFGEGALEGGTAGIDTTDGGSVIYVADPGAAQAPGAISGSGAVYRFEEGPLPEVPVTKVGEVLGTSLVFEGESSPGGQRGEITYHFVYNAGGTCTGGQSTNPAEIAEGKKAQLATEVYGLEPDTTYTYCLVVTNPYGGPAQGAPVSLQTGAQHVGPSVVHESVSDIGAAGAVVHARIIPGKNPLASYYVEYGASSAYGSLTPRENLTGFDEPVTVSVQLSGLRAESEYHVRVVAEDAAGEVTLGEDVAFRTLQPEELALPDDRVLEMVTPAADSGADVFVPEMFTPALHSRAEGTQTRLPFQAAENGEAVAYAGEAAEGGSGQDSEGSGDEFLARRSSGGWSQENIQPPSVSGARYRAFSGELSVGIVEAGLGSEDAPGGPLEMVEADGNVDPLAPAESVYAGSSENGSALFMNASGLYYSTGGKAVAVDVLPDGASEPAATFGAPALRNSTGNPPDFSHVISTDGSRVFWSGVGSGGLYVRENPAAPESPRNGQGECTVATDACTIQLDAKTTGSGTSGGGRFWTASANGSRVFFTDENKLTASSTAAPGAPDLYEYELAGEAGKPGTLRDLTAHAGEPAGVQGVLGASEDGSYVYFVADGALASGSQPQDCEALPATGEPTGGCNLYVLHEGTIAFIATLSSQDGVRVLPAAADAGSSGEFGDWQPGLGHRTAEVSADGKSLVFTSDKSLTGYDNVFASNGESLEDVYRYSYASGLACASCAPGGEQPEASGEGAGGFLPVSWSDTYQPQWMSEDGSRVFFDSAQRLAAQDSNGVQDVYEWEQDEAGACHLASGCVFLLSGGTSPHASWLLDASADGNDVFIATRAHLLVEDETGEDYAVYDARIGGVRPPAQASCPVGGCLNVPPLPPVFATPASATFEGVGNFAAATPTVTQVTKPTSKKKGSKPKKKARRTTAKKRCGKSRGTKKRQCPKGVSKAAKRGSGRRSAVRGHGRSVRGRN